MRLFVDLKKPNNNFQKNFQKYFLAFFLILSLVAPFAGVQAQTAQELNDKISQRNTDIQKLEQEIAQYQSELDTLGKQKSSLSSSIKALDITRKKLAADISVTENKIEKTNLTIQSLSKQIVTKENAIEIGHLAISSGIRQMSELEKDTTVMTMLSGADFTSLWNNIESNVVVTGRIKEKTQELKLVKGELEDTRQQTVDAKNELLNLKSDLADQKKIVDQNTKQKQQLLTQTKNNESNYQKLLLDRIAKKDAFEKELRDYESQLKYILDPSKLPPAGVLSWPLSSILVTQYFGKTQAGKRLYANGTHNGTDFRASVGTPVMAMADGVVDGTGNTDVQCPGVSFGKFILIKYNNGLASTFGHLSLIKVSAGERVTRGQIVGYSGNTGYSTGPHLHVSVYARDAVSTQTLPSKSCPGKVLTQPISPVNAYLDPMYYLPPYKN